jgi:hypothetical protein
VYRVAIYGVGPDNSRNLVEIDAEHLSASGGDLDWESLADTHIRDVPPAHHRPSPAPHGARHWSEHELVREGRFGELLELPDLAELLGPPLLRDVEIRLPRDSEPGERFRLVLTEWEVRSADSHHLEPAPPPGRDPRHRPVYVETIELI